MRKSSKMFKIIFLVASICIGAMLVYALICLRSDGIRDGKYYIVNCEKYPDAYIVISDNKMRLYNIDLNELYQERILSEYYNLVEHHGLEAMSEEQLKYVSDYNERFVNNEWLMDYENSFMSKKGTFIKIWFFHTPDAIFGLVMQYDSWKGQIQINDPDHQLLFKKKIF